MSGSLRFDGRVVLVTGAGNGLGREYALAFAQRGAKVIVNDLGGDIKGGGQSSRPADLVVEEIRANGGTAVANYDSVEEGEKLVKTALENFGRIDVIVNNAGILRDRSFARISDADWDIIHRIHLRSVFLITRAAWPHMKEHKYGRIITVTSSAGIYGNFGQANYSAAKLGVLGLTNTLAIEGRKDNILCNCVAPLAGSRLTQTVMPENMIDALKPEYVSPLVLWLCHESFTETGGLFECGAGGITKLRWQSSTGAVVRSKDVKMTPEAVRDNWTKILDFTTEPTYPSTVQESNLKFMSIIASVDGGIGPNKNKNKNVTTNKTAAQAGEAVGSQFKENKFAYTERDAIMYALGVGVSTKQPDYLKFLFESSIDFSVLPTYAVIPAMEAVGQAILSGDFKGFKVNPVMILHGEQYLELMKPLSPRAVLTSKGYVADVVDKGSGAVIVCNVDTFDERGEKVFFNQEVIFVQKAGGFGGKRSSDKIVSMAEAPSRPADAFIEEITSIDQAALYRLSGDKNPLHIDPDFAAMGGFPQPILHGLCSFGYAARHVLKQYCDNDVSKFKAIKVRFTSPVLPGQTLRTDMWKENNRVFFQCKVVETGKLCLTGAYIDLHPAAAAAAGAGPAAAGPAVKSGAIFEEIAERVRSKPALVETNAVFLFNITEGGNTAASYTVDLTGKASSSNAGGSVFKGRPEDRGSKPADCTVTISDDDFVELASGRLQGMHAFSSGRLKVTGNVMLMMRLQNLFQEQSKL